MPETILLQVNREQQESDVEVSQGIPENLCLVFLPIVSVHMFLSVHHDLLLLPVKANEEVSVVLIQTCC